MKLRSKQIRLQGLLRETITLLCKNGLQYKNCFSVDALIGITTDDNETFLVKLDEKLVDGDIDGKTKDYQNNENVDSEARFQTSRKRPVTEKSDSAPSKRRRADTHGNIDNDDYNTANTNIGVARELEDNVVIVKGEETCKSEHHNTQFVADHNQSNAYEGAPDGTFDGGSRDSSTAWNQSIANDSTNASVSQQVRGLGVGRLSPQQAQDVWPLLLTRNRSSPSRLPSVRTSPSRSPTAVNVNSEEGRVVDASVNKDVDTATALNGVYIVVEHVQSEIDVVSDTQPHDVSALTQYESSSALTQCESVAAVEQQHEDDVSLTQHEDASALTRHEDAATLTQHVQETGRDHQLSTSDDAENRNFCPLPGGQFHTRLQAFELLKTSTTSLPRVPRGRKDNVWFIVDNTSNVAREKAGLSGRYWDDCGSYVSGGNLLKCYYRCRTGEPPRGMYFHKGVYGNRVRRNNERVFEPMQPQPPKSEVLIMMRKYSVLRASKAYLRRVTFVVQLPDCYAQHSQCLSGALYEYQGTFPGNVAHGNAKGQDSRKNKRKYQRTHPELIDNLKSLLRQELTPRDVTDVYVSARASTDVDNMDLPRDTEQVRNLAYNIKRKSVVLRKERGDG